jgi:1-phosphatidylinositol-4-phosphate 5-kinase
MNLIILISEGSAETQPHKTGLFKFKDYSPLVFRHLREKFCIDPADYMVSLCNTLDDGQNALRELPTPGKSGSLFFFSHDMRYILKTIPKREAKLLRYLLPDYYHVRYKPIL